MEREIPGLVAVLHVDVEVRVQIRVDELRQVLDEGRRRLRRDVDPHVLLRLVAQLDHVLVGDGIGAVHVRAVVDEVGGGNPIRPVGERRIIGQAPVHEPDVRERPEGLEERRGEHRDGGRPVAVAGHHEVEVAHGVGAVEAADLHDQGLPIAGIVVDDDRAGGHPRRDGDRTGERADIAEGDGGGAGIAELVVAVGGSPSD